MATKKKSIEITVKASSDDTVIIWRYPNKIKDCWGFAILRQRKGESEAAAEYVKSSVGFAGEKHDDFETHDTTMWPVQRFIWTDYLVEAGDTVRYKVIPMIHKNGKLEKDEANASQWSDYVTLDLDGTEAYFNRGLVSSQFVARRLADLPEKERKKSLDAHLNEETSPLRDLMGGALLKGVYSVLDEPLEKNNEDVHLFTALYELNDVVLIKKLNALGKRAHVILANGAFSADKKDKKTGKIIPGDPDPQAPNAAKLTKVDLTRRIVKSPHFAHNKFAILARKTGPNQFEPYKVLFGSTNWTHNGLFTQVNNAVITDNATVAKYYYDEWKVMKADCDADGNGLYAKPFKDHNATVKNKITDKIHTWFTPTAKLGDLNDATTYIKGAKQGILFLMFKPGTISSALLYDEILKRQKDILVHGVINADPGGKENPTIRFVQNGKEQDGSYAAVTPDNIKEKFEFWAQELAKPSVTIHSKAIVIDPFGDKPVVITGSNNMGTKASKSNDDNLNIIVGNSELAEAYCVHMMAVYHHFRWRFYRAAPAPATGKAKPKWAGLIHSDSWQGWYDKGEMKQELSFWMGDKVK